MTATDQILADKGENHPHTVGQPDEVRKSGQLHRTTGPERGFRDRGNMPNSAGWSEHQRRERD